MRWLVTMRYAVIFAAVFAAVFYVQVASKLSDTMYGVLLDSGVHAAHSLSSHVIETHTVKTAFQCNTMCVKQCLCLSFNFCEKNKLCQLNDRRKEDYPEHYYTNDECTYYGLSWPANPSKVCATRTCSGCCLTSTPCSKGAACRAVDHVDGERFQCACPDGFTGKRCFKRATKCVDYANMESPPPPKPSYGVRVIHTGPKVNDTLRVICHFGETQTMTLAMSYSHGNDDLLEKQNLAIDFPVKGDSPNWMQYRLSLSHMEYLRNTSTKWAFTCAYDTRGFSTNDYLLSTIAEIDPITFSREPAPEPNCRTVEYLNIKDNIFENHQISPSQGLYILHIASMFNGDCDGISLTPGVPACPNTYVGYFGHYYPCYDPNFSCTMSATSTTQLWFVD